jgi:protease-4
MKMRRVLLFVSAVAVSVLGWGEGYARGVAGADEDTTVSAHVPVLTIGGAMPEQLTPLNLLLGQGETVHQVAARIRSAGTDDNVDALVLRFEFPELSMAQAMELESAVRDARDAGKKIYVTADAFNILDYVVATAATEIVVPPVSVVDLHGVSLQFYYLKDMLAHVGVAADVVAVGKYKDALEPLNSSTMSPETREAMTLLMEDFLAAWSERVGSNRGLTPAAARSVLVGGPYTATAALRTAAVDRIEYPDAFLDQLEESLGGNVDFNYDYGTEPKKPAAGLGGGNLFSLFSGLGGALGGRSSSASAATERPKIVVVHAEGPIVDGRADRSNPLAPEQVIASEDFVDLLREAADEPGAAALVLRVNSPGGSAIASDRIWEELTSIQMDGLPVVVSMGDAAASGGYYISAGADKIFAEPTTITGSIGVIGGKLNLSGTYDLAGVKLEALSIGDQANIYTEGRAWNPAEREVMKQLLLDIYGSFTSRVSDGREIPLEKMPLLAEGRVWSGRSALANGLVDHLGGLHDAIEAAKVLAKANPDAPVVTYPKALSPMELIQQVLSGQAIQAGRPPALTNALAVLPKAQGAQLLFLYGALHNGPVALTMQPIFWRLR